MLCFLITNKIIVLSTIVPRRRPIGANAPVSGFLISSSFLVSSLILLVVSSWVSLGLDVVVLSLLVFSLLLESGVITPISVNYTER